MKYNIIAIGDELLIGQVVDTNSSAIASMLSPHGWQLGEIRVVGDDAEAITVAVKEAMQETRVVLMTGGLGPTRDDITKKVLRDYFGGRMIFDKSVEANLERVFARRGLVVNNLTRSQALVPSSCRVINNLVGTAPIMWFERNDCVLVSLPGVPHEALTMMREVVIPQLLARFNTGENIRHQTFVLAGIIESRLAEALGDIEDAMPSWIKLAYLPSPGYIRLRLTGSHADVKLLEQAMQHEATRLRERMGQYIIADEDLPVAEILGRALRERGLTVVTAESCTGGNIAHRITQIPGSSDYFKGGIVAYANEVKQSLLGVPEEMLSTHGAVSEPVVSQMAIGACEALQADCAIATSGIAGPGGTTAGKIVGTVWMAVAVRGRVYSLINHFPGNRDRVIDRASTESMLMLLSVI